MARVSALFYGRTGRVVVQDDQLRRCCPSDIGMPRRWDAVVLEPVTRPTWDELVDSFHYEREVTHAVA